MPEGSEVRCVADTLHILYVNKIIVDIQIDSRSRYWVTERTDIKPAQSKILQDFHRGIEELRKRLPLKVLLVRSRGKKIIFELEGDNYLVSSLGMEGRWIPSPTVAKGDHSNLWISFGNKSGRLTVVEETAYYDDSRHFGALEFCFSRAELDDRLSDLGPDMLQDDVTKETWLSILKNSRLKNKQICDFLLDQNRIAGVGNYLRAEIMWRARIRPNRTLGELSDDEMELLRVHTIATMKESYALGGCTLKSYWDPLGRKGNFKCVVYAQKKDPFGNPVQTDTFKDGRTTHWCPAIQI